MQEVEGNVVDVDGVVEDDSDASSENDSVDSDPIGTLAERTIDWATHLPLNAVVNRDALEGLMRDLRQLIEFEPNSVYDLSQPLFNKIQAQLVNACLVIENRAHDPQRDMVGIGDYKRAWITYFKLIRTKVQKLRFGNYMKSGPQQGQPHVVHLLFQRIVFDITVTYETPASRQATT